MQATQAYPGISAGTSAGFPLGGFVPADLAGTEWADLTGFDIVTVLKAQYRAQARQRALVLAAVWEAGLREAGSADHVARMDHPDEWSADEVRAALGLTRTAAESLLGLAESVCVRLPELHAAMAAGELDEPRARLLAEWTADLSQEHAHGICNALLPRCALTANPMLTTGQLREQIKRLAIALDPDWAQRRYENALRERRVAGIRNADGTADLAGYQLPVERVAAACRRIDNLAKAAKAGGDPRRIDHLRADLFCGMTDGTYEGLTDRQILAHLSATCPEPDPDDSDGQVAQWIAESTARITTHRASARAAHAGTEEPASTQTPDTGSPADPARSSADPADDSSDDSDGSSGPGHQSDPAPATADIPAPRSARSPAPAPSHLPSPSRAGVELRVRLSTLLGLDRLPGELAGWGPVHAEHARTLVAGLGVGQWRWALTDDAGHLLRAGLTPARPGGIRLRSAHSKAIVDIVIPESLLTELTTGDLAARFNADPALALGWRPVIRDIARRAAAPEGTGPPPDPGRRHAGAELSRQITLDHPTCVGVGCRAPASTCDLDHLLDYAKGGPTTRENTDPACRHDHRLKHKGGWRLTQIQHGHRWTTRLGHTY
ncbi:MAG: DUF222 domain-containing protein, partial [Sporichthyaceae bacterium]